MNMVEEGSILFTNLICSCVYLLQTMSMLMSCSCNCYSKQKLYVSELATKWAIIVVKWVKISGIPEDGSGNSIQNRWFLCD